MKRMADSQALTVRLHDDDIGRLVVKRSGGIVYEPSTAEPVLSVGDRSGAPWSAGFSRAWFEGLLPEGDLRTRVAARFEVEPSDTHSLLGAIGWECAGAVAIVPPSYTPADAGYLDLSDAQVGERLDALPGHPYDDDSALRISLGGQQDKLVLARLDGRWRASIGGSATTHILKPEPPEWPGLVEAEAWSLHLVGHVTAAATAEVAPSLGDRPTLVVTRFDRTQSGDQVTRLHQEDVCQVLGLLPSRKYSEHPGRDGDPSYRVISEILRANAIDVPEQLRTLLRQMVAHVVLMDTDAHGKNVSFLHDGQGYIRLSPVYDIVPTTAFLGRQRHLAMSVNGKYRVDQIDRSDLFAEGVSWGYPRSQAQVDVEAAISGLDAAIPAADAAFPSLDPRARLQVTGQLFRLQKSS